MFGRQSRLPIDFKFSIENQNHLPQSYPEFVQNWHEKMSTAYQVASPDSSKITKIPHTKQRVISHNQTNNECSSNESEDDCIEVTPNIIKHFARNEIISENEVEEGVMIHQTNTSVSDENVVDQILVNTSIDSDTSSLNQINDTLDSNIPPVDSLLNNDNIESDTFNTSSDESSIDSPVVRRSTRNRVQRRIFTYDEKGQPYYE